jgi:hypothetical protein
MEAAIWIRRSDREAWLVEVVPVLKGVPHPERPIVFTPGLDFRYPLNLFVSDFDGLAQAIRNDLSLAHDIAEGEVLSGTERGAALKQVAKLAIDDHAQAG